MERLTKRGKGICVGLTACFDKCDHAISGCDCVRVRGAINRLAAYEDSGLEPEEIPQWIPCNKLPDKPQDCLCLFDDGSMAIYWSNGAPYTFGNGAIYWQPLPQPPKGEKP
jgi:hypothetical protein